MTDETPATGATGAASSSLSAVLSMIPAGSLKTVVAVVVAVASYMNSDAILSRVASFVPATAPSVTIDDIAAVRNSVATLAARVDAIEAKAVSEKLDALSAEVDALKKLPAEKPKTSRITTGSIKRREALP